MALTKTKNKSKALKTKNKNSFFRALIFGFSTCVILRIVLAFAFAFFMFNQKDSNALGGVFSILSTVVSLFAGGFVAGKCNKNGWFLTTLSLGCAVVAVCYLLSCIFNLSYDMNVLDKTLCIAFSFLCPIFGGGIASREAKTNSHRRKRM